MSLPEFGHPNRHWPFSDAPQRAQILRQQPWSHAYNTHLESSSLVFLAGMFANHAAINRLTKTQLIARYAQDRISKPSNLRNYRPYSRLGTITGPYFIGALYPPSFCTMKSTAKLSLPLPWPGTDWPNVPLTISGS